MLHLAARREDNLDLRAQAVFALGKIGDPEDVPVILERGHDIAWPVRAQVATALGLIGDVAAIGPLQQLARDKDWWVRTNAGRALAHMGPAGERALINVLSGEDAYARDSAAATLESEGVAKRVVRDLAQDGARGEHARAVISAMVSAGAVRYLHRLSTYLTDSATRRTLESLLDRGETHDRLNLTEEPHLIHR